MEDKQVYLIVRQGMYMQGIFGVFLDLDETLENAKVCIALEKDDHHTYYILRCPLDKISTNIGDFDSGGFDDELYYLSRKNGDVTVKKANPSTEETIDGEM